MPNKTAARKYIKCSRRRYLRNRKSRKGLRETIKKLESALNENKKEKIQDLLKDTVKALDKASQGGILKKNTASRKKSQLARKVNSLSKTKRGK